MKRLWFLFSVVIFSLAISACSRKTTYEDVFDAAGLAQVQNEKHLRSLITQSSNVFRSQADTDGITDDDAGNGDESGNEHSTTNVQVDGIDEGDRVKTDGDAIYIIKDNVFRVVEVGNGLSERFVKDYDIAEYGSYTELYLTEQYVIAIGSYYDYTGSDESPRPDIDDAWDGPSSWWGYIYGSTITTVEIFNKDTLDLVTYYEVQGNVRTTRLVGENLYLVNTHTVYQDDDELRPFFGVDGVQFFPEYDEIRYLPEVSKNAFTVITHINLESTPTLNYDLFLGSIGWGSIYVSHNNIYFVTHLYTDTSDATSRDGTTDDADASVDSTSATATMFSLLMSFEFTSDGSLTYGGHARFNGYVINQFAIDEHDGYVRLVSTEGWGDNVVNRLYVFERNTVDGKPTLETVSMLDEGIGKPRETVRSVRFQGDMVTVVTFEMVDPFYTIDLSNPEAPVIVGELDHIPGFATYQHPWKNDTIIGVGYETNDNGWTIGLKLTLFDVSDPFEPKEIGSPLVLLNESQGWQYGEALHNHKAILVSRPFNFIGFVIESSSWQDTYEHHSNYLIFSIDVESDDPITIGASISHGHLDESEETGDWYYYRNFGIDRAVTINDTLYVISGVAVTAHDIFDDFETIDTLVFD